MVATYLRPINPKCLQPFSLFGEEVGISKSETCHMAFYNSQPHKNINKCFNISVIFILEHVCSSTSYCTRHIIIECMRFGSFYTKPCFFPTFHRIKGGLKCFYSCKHKAGNRSIGTCQTLIILITNDNSF